MEKNLEFKWRPYLYLSFLSPDTLNPNSDSLQYSFKKCETSDPYDSATCQSVDIDGLSLYDTSFKNINFLCYTLRYKIRYTNRGQTPLRILKYKDDILSQSVWVDNFRKSDTLLFRDYYDLLWTKESEIILHPESCFISIDALKCEGCITIDDFLKYKSTGQLSFYPFTLIQYEDYFGHDYNSLIVYRCFQRFEIDSNGFVIMQDPMEVRLEKFGLNFPHKDELPKKWKNQKSYKSD